MTVKELVEHLKNYPGDMRVLTLGYEGGYNDMGLKTDNILFNVNDKDTWYIGPHETPGMKGQYEETGEKCVIVIRTK
jgi:hypothetical protein